MKCETPERASVSSREPVPIQNPSETDRTLGTRSLIRRSPVGSVETSNCCTGRCYRGTPLAAGDDLPWLEP
jgi:hypothetical protein